MGDYIIGRGRYARETYPERNTGAGPAAFAANFAIADPAAPGQVLGSPGPTLVTWTNADVGAVPGTSIPITPRVTGRVRVILSLLIENTGNADALFQVAVTATPPVGPPISFGGEATIAPAGFDTITFVTDFSPAFAASLPVGGTTHLSVSVNAPNAAGKLQFGYMDIQELQPATG